MVHCFTFYLPCFFLFIFVPESSSGLELLPEHRAPSKPTVRQTASPQCPCENGAVGIMSSKYQVIMYRQPRGLWWRPGKLRPPAKLQWPPLRVKHLQKILVDFVLSQKSVRSVLQAYFLYKIHRKENCARLMVRTTG